MIFQLLWTGKLSKMTWAHTHTTATSNKNVYDEKQTNITYTRWLSSGPISVLNTILIRFEFFFSLTLSLFHPSNYMNVTFPLSKLVLPRLLGTQNNRLSSNYGP